MALEQDELVREYNEAFAEFKKQEVEQFVEWFWSKYQRFPGENPTILHKGELQEGMEEYFLQKGGKKNVDT